MLKLTKLLNFSMSNPVIMEEDNYAILDMSPKKTQSNLALIPLVKKCGYVEARLDEESHKYLRKSEIEEEIALDDSSLS